MKQPVEDDAILISRIRKGDLEAFEALYHRHKTRVYHTALAITHDEGAAEEILQDCFVRAYRHMNRLDTTYPISPWLHRIAVNLSYNWTIRQRRRALPLEEVTERLVAGPQSSPERAAEHSELQGLVQEAIDSLSFPHQIVVILYYLQGFTLSEIAYILDCPTGTVKSRLHYACKNLRKHLSADRRLPQEVIYGFS